MLLTISVGESILQLVFVTAVFLFVLFVTHFVTRWLSGYMKAQSFNKNLRIVETLRLTSNKYIQLIEAGNDRYFLIAIGKDEITKLGELSAEELKEEASDYTVSGTGGQKSFEDILRQVTDRLPNTRK